MYSYKGAAISSLQPRHESIHAGADDDHDDFVVVWVHDEREYAPIHRTTSKNLAQRVYSGSPKNVIQSQGWRPVVAALRRGDDPSFYDWACRNFEPVFRYFFRYDAAQRGFVYSFCSAVSDRWASVTKKGATPSDWQEDRGENGTYLLQFDATVSQAVQYGQEERVAQQVDDFARVDFAKSLSPTVDWPGMSLTDPRDGSHIELVPGDLHLTSDSTLEKEIGTVVSRGDLIKHWDLIFS